MNLETKLPKEVYPPSEDSYFFVDYLEENRDRLFLDVWMLLEVGCGSGFVAEHVNNMCRQRLKKELFTVCTDINKHATTWTKSKLGFSSKRYDVLNTDTVTGLVIANFDLVLFNTPYVLVEEVPKRNSVEESYNGGKKGIRETEKLLELLLPEFRGRALLLLEEKCDLVFLEDLCAQHCFRFIVVAKKKVWNERLLIAEVCKKSAS